MRLMIALGIALKKYKLVGGDSPPEGWIAYNGKPIMYNGLYIVYNG